MRYDSGVGEREQFVGSIANLGKGFLEVFVSFGDMITGTLVIKAETKKSEIVAYFSKIAIRNTVDEGLKGINEVLGEIKQGESVAAKVIK